MINTGNIKFSAVGEGYAGMGKKPYIRIHLDEGSAKFIPYQDLCDKLFLFRSDTGDGQYTVMAPYDTKGTAV